jgi:hypothetical protein
MSPRMDGNNAGLAKELATDDVMELAGSKSLVPFRPRLETLYNITCLDFLNLLPIT